MPLDSGSSPVLWSAAEVMLFGHHVPKLCPGCTGVCQVRVVGASVMRLLMRTGIQSHEADGFLTRPTDTYTIKRT